jgi:putative toxin-antitoxin system antitoxin component (TIGR02293 family)
MTTTTQSTFDAKISEVARHSAPSQASPQAVRRGFGYEAMEAAARDLGLTREQVASVLGTSSRTLQRRRSRRLSAAESDRLWRLRRIQNLAVEAFEGEHEEARAWLTSAKHALGGETPVAYLDTEAGARQVEQMIASLTYTMPA